MTAYTASANTDVAARRGRSSRHVPAVRNHSASSDHESYHGSASELPPATSHGYAEWDFSGVPDPVMFRRFLDAADYLFGYFDDSSAGSYDPDDHANSANAGAGGGEAPRHPKTGLFQGAGPSAPPTSLARGRHQRAASPSARARGKTHGGVPHGAATLRLHRRRSLRARRTRA
jgi:hypothetical protein